MGFKHNYNSVDRELPTYSNVQLAEFGLWLEKFRKEVKVRSFNGGGMETIHPIDVYEAMVEFGAMGKHKIGEVVSYSIILNILERDDYGGIKRVESPTKFDIFNDKFEQWTKLQGRREYAKKMETKHLEEVAALASDMRMPESDIEPEPVPEAPAEQF